jgi:hypothetical protein
MFLSSIRALARSVGAEARNPKWASNGALELDIFCPTNADFETFLAAASPIVRTEFVTDLNKAPEYLAEDEILSKARRLFNAERYWECHEVLEGLWRQKQGEEKRLLQGIILLCAAYVHHQKGEAPVAFSVLRRAIPQLESSRPTYWGFRVQILRAKAESMLRAQRFENFRV